MGSSVRQGRQSLDRSAAGRATGFDGAIDLMELEEPDPARVRRHHDGRLLSCGRELGCAAHQDRAQHRLGEARHAGGPGAIREAAGGSDVDREDRSLVVVERPHRQVVEYAAVDM